MRTRECIGKSEWDRERMSKNHFLREEKRKLDKNDELEGEQKWESENL